MSIQEAYNSWSTTYDYDKNLTRDLDRVFTRDGLAGLRCEAILELGCGTGKNTLLLSQIGKKVHAVDFSEGMIKKAQENLKLSNVTFSVADITRPWDRDQQSFNLIVCNLVLEHIEDLSFIFLEAFCSLSERTVFYL